MILEIVAVPYIDEKNYNALDKFEVDIKKAVMDSYGELSKPTEEVDWYQENVSPKIKRFS